LGVRFESKPKALPLKNPRTGNPNSASNSKVVPPVPERKGSLHVAFSLGLLFLAESLYQIGPGQPSNLYAPEERANASNVQGPVGWAAGWPGRPWAHKPAAEGNCPDSEHFPVLGEAGRVHLDASYFSSTASNGLARCLGEARISIAEPA
jgi:hypothetical protein